MVVPLKEKHPEVSLSKLCGLFGFTRQGYWEQQQEEYREEMDNVLQRTMQPKTSI